MNFLLNYSTGLSWNYQTALWGVGLAALVGERVGNWTAAFQEYVGATGVGWFTPQDPLVPAVLMVSHPQGVSIGVEGTRNLSQWMSYVVTANMRSFPNVPGLVFSPFALAGEAVYLTVRSQVQAGTPLVLAGNSLGGAAAAIAARLLARDGYPIRGVFCYGTPRVGDWDFLQGYTLPAFHCYDWADVVTRMPLDGFASLGAALDVGLRVDRCFNVGAPVQVGDPDILPSPAGLRRSFFELLRGHVQEAVSYHFATAYCRKLYDPIQRVANEPLGGLLGPLFQLGYLVPRAA